MISMPRTADSGTRRSPWTASAFSAPDRCSTSSPPCTCSSAIPGLLIVGCGADCSTYVAYMCRLHDVKLTGPLERVLRVFLADPSARRYGYDLMKAARLPGQHRVQGAARQPGRLHQVVAVAAGGRVGQEHPQDAFQGSG